MCPCVPGCPDHTASSCSLNTPSDKHCRGETEAGALTGGWGGEGFFGKPAEGRSMERLDVEQGEGWSLGPSRVMEMSPMTSYSLRHPRPGGRGLQRVLLPPAKGARGDPGTPSPQCWATQGASVALAGPEGLVPELCPSAVPGLPQDSLRKGWLRERWGTLAIIRTYIHRGYRASAASSRTWPSTLPQQTRLQAREREQMGESGERRREKQAEKKGQGWECRRHRSRWGQAAATPEPPAAPPAAPPQPPAPPAPGSQLSHRSAALGVGEGRGAEPGHAGAFRSEGRMGGRASPLLSPRRDSGVASDTGSPLLPMPCTGAATATPPAPSRPPSPPLLFLPSRRHTHTQHLPTPPPQPCWPRSPPQPCPAAPLTWLGWSPRAAGAGDAAERWPALLHLGGRRDACERSAAPAVTSTAPSLPPLIPRPHLADSPRSPPSRCR